MSLILTAVPPGYFPGVCVLYIYIDIDIMLLFKISECGSCKKMSNNCMLSCRETIPMRDKEGLQDYR